MYRFGLVWLEVIGTLKETIVDKLNACESFVNVKCIIDRYNDRIDWQQNYRGPAKHVGHTLSTMLTYYDDDDDDGDDDDDYGDVDGNDDYDDDDEDEYFLLNLKHMRQLSE